MKRPRINIGRTLPWTEREARYMARWQARYRAERLDDGRWRGPVAVAELELSEIADSDLPEDVLRD